MQALQRLPAAVPLPQHLPLPVPPHPVRCQQPLASRHCFSGASCSGAQNHTVARRVRAHVFDNLKNLLGNMQKLPQQGKQDEEEFLEEEEGEEGGTMQPIDPEDRRGMAEDGGAFGPLAVLLVGFMASEVDAVRSMLINMEADMIKIIACTPAMLDGPLQAALEADAPAYQQPPLGTRRTIFLSGMYGSEVVEVVGAYRETGLPPAVFAAAVPRNYGRVVRELAAEVHADHMAMMQRMQRAQQQEPGEDDSQE